VKDFWRAFVPLFVAVDAVGVLPLFLALTEGLDARARRPVILQSVATAALVALGFLAVGPVLLRFLGVTIPDFMIAGGLLLSAISLSDLLTGAKRQRQADPESMGPVPIGVPLITGPAVLTTCLVLADRFGKGVTAGAVAANVVLAGVVFWFAEPIQRALGRTGSRTVSKVAGLLLAAIAVMLIRRGIVESVVAAAGP